MATGRGQDIDSSEHGRLLAQVRDANTQLVLAGIEARRRTAELEATLASMPDAVVVYGPNAEILRLNQEAEDLLALSPEARKLPHAERVRIRHVVMEDGQPLDPGQGPVQRALRGETVRGLVVAMRPPRRRSVWMSVSAAPITTAAGGVIGAVAVFSDITRLRDLQERTEKLLEAERRSHAVAEKAVKARDQFISTAAHELKTPVTSLQGYAQVLLRQYKRKGAIDPANLAGALHTIHQQSLRLARLTEQLLEVSRLEAGKLHLSREEFDLTVLVRNAIAEFRDSHPDRVLKFTGDEVLAIVADPLRLEQVMVNLLDNAAKFSPARMPVEVSVYADGSWCTVTIRDHGIGVPLEQQDAIFERFHQAYDERHYAGMGLGLYISRQYAELHGGTLTFERPDGPGSQFVLRLPLNHD